MEQRLQDYRCGGVEVHTVDRFQGRDKHVIILSLVRSNAANDVLAPSHLALRLSPLTPQPCFRSATFSRTGGVLMSSAPLPPLPSPSPPLPLPLPPSTLQLLCISKLHHYFGLINFTTTRQYLAAGGDISSALQARAPPLQPQPLAPVASSLHLSTQVFVGDSPLMRSGGGVMSRIVGACERGGGLLQLSPLQVAHAGFALMSFFE